MSEIIFVSGTDTDAGKSYATGWLAAHMAAEGKSVATMKFVQTGNVGRSEDIEVHRRIMGIDSIPEDALGLTAPEIFSYPASPSLAAKIDATGLWISTRLNTPWSSSPQRMTPCLLRVRAD